MANILIIDDEPDLRAVMRTFLEDAGHEVADAVNGRKGLEKILDGKFDVVVSDIIMPEQGGVELTMEASMKKPSLRWVLISGRVPVTAPPVQSLIRRFGITTILEKPFTRRQLLDAVESALNEHAR